MAETRTISERYAEIGAELIREEPTLARLRDSEATVLYLSSDYARRSKGKETLGECERVPAKWRWAVPCDFTVTVYEPNVQGFSDEQLRALVHHELMHVGVELDKDGQETYFTRPHDIDEFQAIAKLYGLDWAERR